MMVTNGASVSVDSLELSIILNAPYATGFSEIIMNFQKCQDAPFLVSFLGLITYKLIRNYAKLSIILKWLRLPRDISLTGQTCTC